MPSYKNKFDSIYIKQKWKNKHSVKYRCRPTSYGGWWTPPLSASSSKAAKKAKNKEIRKYYHEIADSLTWFDDEIDTIYAYPNDNESEYDNYNNIPVWHCPICTYCNTQKLSFCSYCNAPYHSNQQQSINIKTKHKKHKKRKQKRKISNSFEIYWKEMQHFIKKLNKYTIEESYKENVYGKDISNLLREYTILCHQTGTQGVTQDNNNAKTFEHRHNFSMSAIHIQMRNLCPSSECKIKSLRSRNSLKTLSSSSLVFHGTDKRNIYSIESNGLIIGGTKGIAKQNGDAYGTGIYCSPSLQTASYYSNGSIFVCAASNAKKYGNIWVVPKEQQIVCCYLIEYADCLDFSSFNSSGSMQCNDIAVFIPSLGKLNEAKKFRNRQRKFSNKGLYDGCN